MKHITRPALLLTALLTVLPSVVEAGPPLICHPFQTASGTPLLPWGSGPGWNTPDRTYDIRRLVDDTVSLLRPETPVLSRMEILRRAVIYASKDSSVAEQLLTALSKRAATNGDRLAVFDAGYLIESVKQATHMFGRKVTTEDGYTLVLRAIAAGPSSPEMEFAAALMTEGPRSATHLSRARAAASAEPLLARNITNVGW
jgi:hypothetical protein